MGDAAPKDTGPKDKPAKGSKGKAAEAKLSEPKPVSGYCFSAPAAPQNVHGVCSFCNPPVCPGPCGPLQDSKFGGQQRSGSEYYRKWDQFAEHAAGEVEGAGRHGVLGL